jgi:hypothetical protein
MFKGFGTDTLDIVTMIILAALIVLIVTHASGFATALSSIGGFVTQETSILAGNPGKV